MTTSTAAQGPRDPRTAGVRGSDHSMALALDLLFMLTWREVAIRYKQSVMGLLWALLMPALIVSAGLIVRAGIAHVTRTPLAAEALLAVLVKSLPWAFFVSAIRLATSSFTANSNLVTRARCPRIVFPLSSVLTALFDLAVTIVPAALVLAFFGAHATVQLLWVPVLLVILVVLVGALGVLLATANLFYRDVKYIVEVLLMFGIFLTPVLFDAAMLGEWARWIMLNPIAPLIEGLRAAVVDGTSPDLAWVGYSTAVAAVLALAAWRLFDRLEPSFADNI